MSSLLYCSIGRQISWSVKSTVHSLLNEFKQIGFLSLELFFLYSTLECYSHRCLKYTKYIYLCRSWYWKGNFEYIKDLLGTIFPWVLWTINLSVSRESSAATATTTLINTYYVIINNTTATTTAAVTSITITTQQQKQITTTAISTVTLTTQQRQQQCTFTSKQSL